MELFLEIYLIIMATIKFETMKQALVKVLLGGWELKVSENNRRVGDSFLRLKGLMNGFSYLKEKSAVLSFHRYENL